MPFPKINHPTTATILPSTQKTVRFRPMTGREEKILLTAKEAGESDEILSTVSQVVQNCMVDVDPSYRSGDGPVFDAEWLFVRIRMQSIGPIVEVSYVDRSDQKTYDFEVPLDAVELRRYPVEGSFRVTEDVTIELRWPSVDDYLRARALADPAKIADELLYSSVYRVFDGDQVIDAQKQPREELAAFVDDLPLDAHRKVAEYVGSQPHLYYEINYKNSKGEDRRIVMNRLTDFFGFA